MEAAFNTSSSSSSIPLSFSYTFTAAAAAMGALSTNNNPWMDSRIWSKLPTKLLDRVIAFLPPPAFFRARCVCKRWYSLLFSTSFLHLYIHLSPRRHCFLFFKQKSSNTTTTTTFIYNNNNNNQNPREGYLFDPYDLVWHRLSFSLIPHGFSPAASSGGLVCWISDEAGPKTIFLSNPLIGSVSQLPSPTLRPRLFPSIGLSVGPSSIHVAVAGDDLISPYAVKNISTESFHVDAAGFYSLWGTTSQLPRLCSLESGQMVSVSQGRYLYSMNHSPFSVLGHDVVSKSWLKIQAPMRRFLRSPSLVESGGRVVLVAAVEKSKLNVPRSLRMWTLQGAAAATWVEIERMPQQLYAQFTEVEGGRGFDCVGHGELVVIMIRRSGNRGLLFDMWRKVWQWIPLCPYVDHQQHQLRAFPYHPRLATPVTGLLDNFTSSFN